ncbi:BRO family protein [Glaciimonas sp. Gout2]|uniref:BRO-N domain-containing protein n=1 Tax=unclassified Glaciimonas TaxID=2644401 RepID=UPI002B22DDDE|nr:MULTISPECIES: BRO family protein [unclassified Glaciimonas]MEB0010553.1 BRO family protein [Glaciimonas sp. Cout2]MEB0084835.1 BRO family protein [Glaciimonas sp. Gout2]
MSTVYQSSVLPATFTFGYHTVRTIEKNDQFWFFASDVCAVLHVTDAPQALSRLDLYEVDNIIANDAMGRPQETTLITESGLYSLIMRSRHNLAKAFKRWVTHDVLPILRKQGQPQKGQKRPDTIDVNALLLTGMATPSIARPTLVDKAIDQRARQLSREAFHLIRAHLQRHVAYQCEVSQPNPRLIVDKALDVIAQGTLGAALAHTYRTELNACERWLKIAQGDINESLARLQAQKALKQIL